MRYIGVTLPRESILSSSDALSKVGNIHSVSFVSVTVFGMRVKIHAVPSNIAPPIDAELFSNRQFSKMLRVLLFTGEFV